MTDVIKYFTLNKNSNIVNYSILNKYLNQLTDKEKSTPGLLLLDVLLISDLKQFRPLAKNFFQILLNGIEEGYHLIEL